MNINSNTNSTHFCKVTLDLYEEVGGAVGRFTNVGSGACRNLDNLQ